MTGTGVGIATPEERVALDAAYTALAVARARVNAWQAREAELLHAVTVIAGAISGRGPASSRVSELPFREVAAEVGGVLRVSDRTAQRLMGSSVMLVEEFPATFASFRAGRLSRGHVHVIVDAGAHVRDAVARGVFEAEVVPFAEREVPARVRPFARQVAERVHPRSLTERHKAAAACRAVRVVDLDDGMSELIATLPSVIAHGVLDRVQQMAHTVREAGKRRTGQRRAGERGKAEGRGAQGPAARGHAGGDAVRHGAFGQPNGTPEQAAGEPHGPDTGPHDPPGEPIDARSIDEIRADILADLLLTGAPDGHTGGSDDADGTSGGSGGLSGLGGLGGLGALGAIRARVQITVPVLSLIGRSDLPGTLAGVGPIDPGTARELAGGSTGWDRILTDPITGAVLAVDRYTPSRQLKRTLRVRDAHCRFPGCRLSVDRSDIDHTIDYAHGGTTRLDNLAHLCRRHHTLKHATAWRVTQRPGGVLEWTSPTGRVYPDVPTSTVMFRPVHDRHLSRGDDSDRDAARGDAARGDAPRGDGPSGAGAASGVTEDPPPF